MWSCDGGWLEKSSIVWKGGEEMPCRDGDSWSGVFVSLEDFKQSCDKAQLKKIIFVCLVGDRDRE